MREGAKSSPCRLLPLRVCVGEVDRSVVMRSPCAGVFIPAVPITKLVAWGEGEEEFDGPSVSSLAGLERQRSQSVA